MSEKQKVTDLIAELKTASQLYYQNMEDSPLTDEEFDNKIEQLSNYSLKNEYSYLFAPETDGWKLLENDVSLGTSPTTDEIITHKTPMLSLAKAKNKETLENYVRKARKAGASDFKLQAKLDGFALSATYENGQIKILATRGTGLHGEDITYMINAKDVTIKGLPKNISIKEQVELRGELFFTKEQFDKVDESRLKIMGARFKNPRNAVVGLMKKTKLGVDYPVEFTFAAYAALINNMPKNIETIDDKNIISVDSITQEQAPEIKLSNYKNDEEFFDSVEKFGVARRTFTIPTDGVVIKPSNESEMLTKMGTNSHHPLSQIAYKYPGETADSVVLAISVTVGKTGKLTPRAHIRPVIVDGSLIENFTMNNYNWVHEKDVRIGSEVRVHKANDIIPEIKLVLNNPENTERVKTPTECPVCETELYYDKNDVYPPKTLTCPNNNCPSRDFFALKTAVGKKFLDIDGLSEVTLTTLNETGRINNISDLYTLTLEELANSQLGTSVKGNPRRLGEARAKNILEHIEKSKTLPLYRLLMSLNIAQMGPQTAKDLVKKFGSLENIQKATFEDLTTIEGVGEILSEKIVSGLELRQELISKLQSHGVKFENEQTTTNNETNSPLTGVSFSISGSVPAPFANRNEWIEYVENNGGEFHSAPKPTTTYIIGDKNDTSSKIKKALTLGTQFLTPEEFTNKFTS